MGRTTIDVFGLNSIFFTKACRRHIRMLTQIYLAVLCAFDEGDWDTVEKSLSQLRQYRNAQHKFCACSCAFISLTKIEDQAIKARSRIGEPK